MCFPFPLDLNRRITLAFGFCSFRLGSRVRCFCLPLVSLGGLHRLPLCSSFLCVAFFCSVGFLLLASFLASPCWTFATVSSFGFHLLLSLAACSVPLLLLCSTCCFGWSSGRLVAFCVLLALLPSLFWLGSSFSPVSGFQLLMFRVFRWSSTGFSFLRHCFPFFL